MTFSSADSFVLESNECSKEKRLNNTEEFLSEFCLFSRILYSLSTSPPGRLPSGRLVDAKILGCGKEFRKEAEKKDTRNDRIADLFGILGEGEESNDAHRVSVRETSSGTPRTRVSAKRRPPPTYDVLIK